MEMFIPLEEDSSENVCGFHAAYACRALSYMAPIPGRGRELEMAKAERKMKTIQTSMFKAKRVMPREHWRSS